MAIDALVKPLSCLPIFDGLSPEQLGDIARAADRVLYRSGDVIVAENQTGEAAVLIISGKCFRVDADSPRGGELVPEGSLIGELAMLVEMQHGATIIAQSRVKALRLTRDALRQVMEKDGQLAEHFIARIVQRLKSMAESLAEIDRMMGADVTAIPVSQYVEPHLISPQHSI